MTTVLAIDTSTRQASVAIVASEPAGHVLAESRGGSMDHAERLLVLIDDALGAAGCTLDALDAIAVGAGPGSFTGLRIGMATAKGLAFASGKPLWAVSSLAALAWAAAEVTGVASGVPDVLVVPLLDARRGEIFAGFYRLDGERAVAVASERVLAPAAVASAIDETLAGASCSRAIVLGDALAVYADALAGLPADRVERAANVQPTPRARAVGRLALAGEHRDDLASAVPAYIRLAEAELAFPDGNPGGTFSPRK